MEFELLPALIAGVIGGIAMILARELLRAVGMSLRMNVNRIWGTMFKARGESAVTLGFFVHLTMSALIALLYAVLFDVLQAEEWLVLWALLGFAVHYTMAGAMMALLPYMHPQVDERLPAPGAFAKNLGGGDVFGFMFGHLVFAITVVIVYAWLAGDISNAFGG